MSAPRVEPLILPAPAGCEELTFPFFHSLLAGGPAATGVHAQVLWTAAGPGGLCLARTDAAGGTAQVLSLCVASEYRNRGWGARLLTAVEADLRRHGAMGALLVYSVGGSTPALEAVLRRCGWGAPQVRMILCRSDAAHILQAPWIRDARLAEGFTFFPWRELSAEERRWISGREGTPGWHPATLSPFKEEEYYDPETSLGLRCHGELAGWLVTHRVIPGSVRYTNLFVRADVRRKAPHLPMVAEAIRRQIASSYYAYTPCGMFNQPVDDPAVHRFFARRLEPYLISIKETKGSWKRLN